MDKSIVLQLVPELKFFAILESYGLFCYVFLLLFLIWYIWISFCYGTVMHALNKKIWFVISALCRYGLISFFWGEAAGVGMHPHFALPSCAPSSSNAWAPYFLLSPFSAGRLHGWTALAWNHWGSDLCDCRYRTVMAIVLCIPTMFGGWQAAVSGGSAQHPCIVWWVAGNILWQQWLAILRHLMGGDKPYSSDRGSAYKCILRWKAATVTLLASLGAFHPPWNGHVKFQEGITPSPIPPSVPGDFVRMKLSGAPVGPRVESWPKSIKK